MTHFNTVLIAIVLFIVINYLIMDEKSIIDDIKSLDKDDENYSHNLELMREKYLSKRFRIYVIRGLIFGITLYISLLYMVENIEEEAEVEQIKTNFFQDIPF